MLLNEFLKEHKAFLEERRKLKEQDCKMRAQDATINEFKKGIGILTAQLKEQAAQIQKVNARLELSRPAAQTVAKDQ
jgi:hypothetical protein